MGKHFRRKPIETDVDMTPMLDIVFIMLIFFIVTSVFLDERGLGLTQLQGAGSNSAHKTVQVYVYKDGSARVNGELTDVTNVPVRVELIRAQSPNAVVLIHAEKEASLDNVVFLEDQFRNARIDTVLKISEQ
jgi:biopolymer transport protein ExbD